MRSHSGLLRSAATLLCLTALASSARADEKAEELLRQVERATKAVPSLGGKLQVTLITQNLGAPSAGGSPSTPNNSGFTLGGEPLTFTFTGTVKLQRPNLERIELAAPVNQTIDCDGTALWTLLSSNEYIKNPADPIGKTPGAYPPVLTFFAPDTARTGGAFVLGSAANSENFASRYLGKERVAFKALHIKQMQGQPVSKETEEFDVVEVRQFKPVPQSVKLYINADKLVVRVVSETKRGNIATIQDVSLVDIRLGQRFDLSEFTFTLPPNARPYVFKPAPVNQ